MAATLAAQAPVAGSGERAAPREAHVDALTGIRALAAGWVVSYHLWLIAAKPALAVPALHIDVTPLAAMGWLGVDVFFVLSGFVLTWQVLHDRRNAAPFARGRFWRDAGAFVRRRVLRVYPAYFATLTVLLPLGWHGLTTPADDLRDVALHLVMAHNVVPAYASTINGVYWSMPFEWQFYLVFPLLVLPLIARRTAWLLAGGVAAAVIAKLISATLGPGAEIAQLPWRIDEFVVGMAAAAFAVRKDVSPLARAALAWLGLASLVAGSYAVAAHDPIWWQPGALPFARAAWIDATVAALVIGLTATGGRVSRFFALAPLVWLGTISYSVYLWHLPTLILVRTQLLQSFATMSLAATLAWGTCAVIAVSALSYYLVEAPFHAPSRSAPPRWRDPAVRTWVIVAWGVLLLAMAIVHYRG
jgi:peptidoglycan/LPS O-acetylase OafA/YrhL